MRVGKRTQLVATKVDAMTSALRGIVVALIVLTVAVVTLALRADR